MMWGIRDDVLMLTGISVMCEATYPGRCKTHCEYWIDGCTLYGRPCNWDFEAVWDKLVGDGDDA